MLGTGHAGVTKCYNTCFVIEDNDRYFLTDGGGGNTLLRQLKKADIRWQDIHHIFVTHRHLDHLTGIFWMMRMILQGMMKGKYKEEAYIYAHDEVINILEKTAELLFDKELACLHKQLHIVTVHDGETMNIIGHEVTFFDIHSQKAKQYGFRMKLGKNRYLTCLGDEPYTPAVREYAEDSTWLMHEAFCMYADREEFRPYEKHHSTVKDACKTAAELNAENLILYHTEDKHLKHRKELYGEEGRKYYKGNLYIPDDLETIRL